MQVLTRRFFSVSLCIPITCEQVVFPLPSNVGLELGQFHRKTITKQHKKRERQVPEQCDTSWLSLIVLELRSIPDMRYNMLELKARGKQRGNFYLNLKK